MEFRGREERTKCYNARDAYFECADKQPEGVDPKIACKPLYAEFESKCGQKWTEHFIRRNKYLKFKSELEQKGFEELDKAKMKG